MLLIAKLPGTKTNDVMIHIMKVELLGAAIIIQNFAGTASEAYTSARELQQI